MFQEWLLMLERQNKLHARPYQSYLRNPWNNQFQIAESTLRLMLPPLRNIKLQRHGTRHSTASSGTTLAPFSVDFGYTGTPSP